MLLVLISISLSSACPIVQCSSASSSTCSQSNSSAVSLFSCQSSSTYCEGSDFMNLLSNNSKYSSLPCNQNRTQNEPKHCTGLYCSKNSDCTSFICKDNQCAGINIGDQCQDDNDCMTNTYCKQNAFSSSGTCTASFVSGQDCDFDNECASGLGCNQGSCIQLYSLSDSSKTDQYAFCISQMQNDNSQCDSILIYVNGKQLASPFSCKIGDICEYRYKVSGKTRSREPCLCDGTSSGLGYCSQYLKNYYPIALQLASYIKYTTSICSGDCASSVDPDILYLCQSITIDNYYAIKNITGILNFWPVYMSKAVDDCALDIGIFDPSFELSSAWVLEVFLVLNLL